MSRREIRVTPPDVKHPEQLTRLGSEALEDAGVYDDSALIDVDWQERCVGRVRFDTALFRNANLSRSRMRDVALTDVRIAGCDLSNADWTGASFRRVEVVSSRLTGFVGAEGSFEDTLFRDCRADYAVFQLSKGVRCHFEKCSLVEATFEAATLNHVVFRDCDLTNARLIEAQLDSVDLCGSRIDGLGILVKDLKGVCIDLLQAPAIAALTGVIIIDRDQE